MLEVSDLGKEYPTPRGPLTVLSGVGFTLEPGDGVAVTGPSGSGKSSLLYILGGLEPPTTGSVSIDGTDLYALSEADQARFRNSRIGFVFQDHCLLPQCSVLENVLVPTLVGETGPDFESRARALIDQVGLAERIDHRPGELSGGEKQRVAIARALIRHPAILLCDEPTGNLDQDSAERVAGLLLDLHRRANNVLVVVTHSESLAGRFPARFRLTGRQLQAVGR